MRGAGEALIAAWGDDDGVIRTGWSPGRCTIVGEHVDYAGGAVVAVATDIGVEVAVRGRGGDDAFRIESAGRRVVRNDTTPRGDIGDRILGAVEVLRRRGLAVPGLDIGVTASLPESAGLSSSAAVTCATLIAVLRLCDGRVTAAELAAAALAAERDIAGIPCGALDQRTVVHAPRGGALLLDFATDGIERVVWPWPDLVLVACATGEAHDIGGDGYRTRRRECTAVMEALRVATADAIRPEAAADLGEPLLRRARHLASETRRSGEAAIALRNGDDRTLGHLMDLSHASLRDDYEVTTPLLDAVAAAARAEAGCRGARMVGGGFGGSVVALTATSAADATREAMARAAGVDAATATWTFCPGAGLAESAQDVVTAAGAVPE